MVVSTGVCDIDSAGERSVAVEGRGGSEGLDLSRLGEGRSRSVADTDLAGSPDTVEERLPPTWVRLGGGGGLSTVSVTLDILFYTHCFLFGGGGGGFLLSFLAIFSTSVTTCWVASPE